MDQTEVELLMASQEPFFSELHKVVKRGDVVETIRVLLQNSESNSRDWEAAVHPIHVACFYGQQECAQLLIDADATCLDVQPRWNNEEHPMREWRALQFATCGGHTEIVNMLQRQ